MGQCLSVCCCLRTAPAWLDPSLVELLPTEIVQVKSFSVQHRLEIKKSFMKTLDFRWIAVGGDGKNKLLDDRNTDEAKQHKKIVSYMIDCILNFSELYGYNLVYQDEQGQVLGSICIIPPYQYMWLFRLHFMRSVIPFGTPLPKTLGAGPAARFDAYSGAEAIHVEQMEEVPHWYVANLAVIRSAQGKGIGKKLIQAACTISNQTGQPVYLECESGNARYYEKKADFKTKQAFKFQPKIDPASGIDASPFTFYAMIYESQSQKMNEMLTQIQEEPYDDQPYDDQPYGDQSDDDNPYDNPYDNDDQSDSDNPYDNQSEY